MEQAPSAARLSAAVTLAIVLPSAAVGALGGASGVLIGEPLEWALSTFIKVLVLAIGAFLTFGLPIYLLFRRRRWLGPLQCIAGALVASDLAAICLYCVQDSLGLVAFLFFSGPLGAAAGLTFWAVAYRPICPNNSSKPTPLRGAA